jgi:hypothetical protein
VPLHRRREANYALQQELYIIPLMLEEGYKAKGWLGMILGTKMWYNFYGAAARLLTHPAVGVIKRRCGVRAGETLTDEAAFDERVEQLVRDIGERGLLPPAGSRAPLEKSKALTRAPSPAPAPEVAAPTTPAPAPARAAPVASPPATPAAPDPAFSPALAFSPSLRASPAPLAAQSMEAGGGGHPAELALAREDLLRRELREEPTVGGLVREAEARLAGVEIISANEIRALQA